MIWPGTDVSSVCVVMPRPSSVAALKFSASPVFAFVSVIVAELMLALSTSVTPLSVSARSGRIDSAKRARFHSATTGWLPKA